MIIDLTGAWDHDVDVDIDTGVGSPTLLLPEDFGAWVDGFTGDDGDYVNDVYAGGKEALDIKVDQGVVGLSPFQAPSS